VVYYLSRRCLKIFPLITPMSEKKSPAFSHPTQLATDGGETEEPILKEDKDFWKLLSEASEVFPDLAKRLRFVQAFKTAHKQRVDKSNLEEIDAFCKEALLFLEERRHNT